MHALLSAPDGPHVVALPSGDLEVYVDQPRGGHPATGVTIVCHPQPLLGGNALHKVPHALATALRDAGWHVLRPNFRGIGHSTGSHDYGDGESQDMLALVAAVRQQQPQARLALLGFSFGAYVQARVARHLADQGAPAWRVCLTGMPFGDVQGQQHYDTPRGIPETLVVHGEQDERVALSAILDWARPDAQPVTVVPGADHFFSGRLPLLRTLVLRHLHTSPDA